MNESLLRKSKNIAGIIQETLRHRIKCNTFCFSSFGRYSVRSVTLKQPRIASKTKTDQCSKVLLIKTISFELKSFKKTTIVKFITPWIDHSRGSSKGALILIHVINNVACLFQKPNQNSPGFTSFGFLRSLSIQSLKVKPSRRYPKAKDRVHVKDSSGTYWDAVVYSSGIYD